MTSLDVRNNSAVMKRAEQLKRWEESDTNQQPATPKPKQGSRIKFSSGCVFLAACLAGEKDEVLNMLEQGADINTTNIDGLTALHQACIDDNLEMVEFLVEHGADINHQDNEGWTPLHATTSCGFVSIARYLVEHGADVAAVNSDGDLAVDLAVDIQHLPMIDFLQKIVNEQQIDCAKARQAEEQQMLNDAKKWLRSDASEVDRPHPKTGHTALHVAAAKGYTKVLSLLLAGRANVDAQDNDGWTALHAAAHWGQKEAAEMLVDAMADMDIRNYSGQTCIDVADRKMVKFLEDLRANNKRIKRRPSSQISRISDTIENHMVDKATTKIIRVEVRPDHNKDHINASTSLASSSVTTTANKSTGHNLISSSMSSNMEHDETDSDLTDSTESSHSTSLSESENIDIKKDENYLPAQKTSNDTTITQLITATASTDDEAPWRRNNTTRTGSGIVRTSFTESTIKNQVPDKGVNNTTSSSMPTTITATAATTTPTTNSNNSNSNDTSDVILRRTQSFENDEKFYQKYNELRARIKANSCPIIPATLQQQRQQQQQSQQNNINNNNNSSNNNSNYRKNILTNHLNTTTNINNNSCSIANITLSSSSTSTTSTTTTATVALATATTTSFATAKVTIVNSNSSGVGSSSDSGISLHSSSSSTSLLHHQNTHITTATTIPSITPITSTTIILNNNNNINNNNIVQRSASLKDHKQMYIRKSPPITPPTPPKIPKTPTSMNTTPVRSDKLIENHKIADTSSVQPGQDDQFVIAMNTKEISLKQNPLIMDNNTATTTTKATKQSAGNIIKNFFKSFVPPVRDEESETQRKAHAKRVRETRRSTQGVTLDEIKSAEELVKKKNSNINNNNNTSSNNNNSSEDGGNSNNNSNNSNNEIQLNTTTADITATTTTTTAVTNSISKEQEQKTDVTISTSTAGITPLTTTTTTTGEKKTVSGALQKLTENIEIMASFTLSAPQGQAKLRTVTTALTATTPTTITATTTTTIPITTTSITLIPRNHHIKNNKTNNDIKIKVDNNKMKNEDVSVEREGEKEKITTFIMSPRKSLTPIENVAATFILSTPMKDKKKSRTDDLVSDDKVIKERNTNVQNVKEDNSNKEQQLTKPTVSTTTANESLKEGQLERSKATNERIRAAFFNTQNSATTTVTTATTTAATLPVTTVNLPVNYREKRSICDSDKNNSNSATYRIELSDIKQKYIDEADKNCHNTSNNNNTNNSKSNNSMDDSKNSPIASVSYNYTSRRSLDSVSSSLPSSPLHHNNNNSNSSNLSGRQKETGGFDITTTTSSSSYGSLSTNIHATTTIAGNINNNTTNTVSNLHAAERRPSWRLKFDSGSKFKLEDATSGNTYLPNNTSIIPSAPAVIAAANLSSIAQRRISAPNNNSSANQISNISVRPVSAPPSSSDTSTTSIININHISSHNSDDNNSNLNSSYTPRPQRVSATTSTTALIPETKNVSINTNHSVSTPITNIANNSSNNTTIHNDNIDNDKENDNRSAQSVIQRRRKPKRRSTGVVHVDMDDIDPDRQDSANDGEEKESGSEQRHTPRSRLETTSSDAASSSSTVANDKKTRDKTDHDDNIDYKALWEAVKLENEKLKQQLKKKDDEITQTRTTLERFANTNTKNSLSENEKRERRAMERKLSELEEELKLLQNLKSENERLRAENRALTRVVSKLTTSAQSQLSKSKQ